MAAEPLGPQQALTTVSALHGFRIVEIAESPAGEYCGKLLADFGADVIKVERPGVGEADAERRDRARAEEGAGLAAYHAKVLSFVGECVVAQQGTSKQLEAG